MRRIFAGLMVILLVGMIGFGGNLEDWASDGTYAYSSVIVVQNVSDTVAHVQVTYQTPCDPTTPDYELTVAPNTRATVNVNDAFPGPWGSAAIVTSNVPVVASQTYLWSDPSSGTQWASHLGGVPTPSTTWYLAEGSTYGEFESYILIQNPGEQSAQVELTYMTPGGTHEGPTFTLDPVGQTEINVADTLPDWSSVSAVVTSDVPVVAQLSTYWNGGASTTISRGAMAPATTWYLAEGNTAEGSGFETWIMVQNPGSNTADVQVTYYGGGIKHNGPNLNVAPMTHDKFNVADTFPDQAHFATVVTSDVPVVAAQSMTWNGHSGYDTTIGVTEPATQWYVPVARSHRGASAWLTVQNVGSTSTDVSVTYMTDTGTVDGPNLALDPFARNSVSLPESVGDEISFSVVITSDQPIIAQHGTYWETGVGVHQDLYFGTTISSTSWYLPITPHRPSQMGPEPDSSPSTSDDRDGDGVPDAEDYCPDFPGSPATNGC